MLVRDVIVLGASAGGLKALEYIARSLSPDLPACVLAVMHLSRDNTGTLARILGRRASLPVRRAETGDPIEHGRIYIAPPDRHLLVREGSVELSQGPRENRSRPALDPLFRSAALSYGARVAGVVLTGLLDDGAAGLLAIKRAGGATIVQDPDDAEFSGMPLSALARVAVDHCVPLLAMPELLEALARGRPIATAPVPAALGRRAVSGVSALPPLPPQLELEALVSGLPPSRMVQELGSPAPVSCPECGGPFWELLDGGIRRYRCQLGHGLTASATLEAQDELIEQSLWLAARALEENAVLLTSLAEDERAAEHEERARDYEERGARSRKEAARIRDFLTRA